MKLSNDFSPYVKSLFFEIQRCCLVCGSNQRCSVHHIFSRISSSMFNGITLCDLHHKEADCFNVSGGMKGDEFRQKLLLLTVTAFYQNQWWMDYLPEEDKRENEIFLLSIEKDFKIVADKIKNML